MTKIDYTSTAETRYKTILALHNRGYSMPKISKMTGYSKHSLPVILSRMRDNPRRVKKILVCLPPVIAYKYIELCNEKEISLSELLTEVLTTVILDDLINAVLDED